MKLTQQSTDLAPDGLIPATPALTLRNAKFPDENRPLCVVVPGYQQVVDVKIGVTSARVVKAANRLAGRSRGLDRARRSGPGAQKVSPTRGFRLESGRHASLPEEPASARDDQDRVWNRNSARTQQGGHLELGQRPPGPPGTSSIVPPSPSLTARASQSPSPDEPVMLEPRANGKPHSLYRRPVRIAVGMFQIREGLPQTRVVDAQTWKALAAA